MSRERGEPNLSITPAEAQELAGLDQRDRALAMLDPGSKPLTKDERARKDELRQKAGPKKTMMGMAASGELKKFHRELHKGDK
jgi:hypothetical protein